MNGEDRIGPEISPLRAYGKLSEAFGGDFLAHPMTGSGTTKQTAHNRKNNIARRDRMRSGKPSRSDIAALIASYEHNTPRPPITLPRISIQQQDAE